MWLFDNTDQPPFCFVCFLVVDDDDNDARMDSLCTSFNELHHAEVGWHLKQTASQGEHWQWVSKLTCVTNSCSFVHSFIHSFIYSFIHSSNCVLFLHPLKNSYKMYKYSHYLLHEQTKKVLWHFHMPKKKLHSQSSIKRHKYYTTSICQKKNPHTQSSIKRHKYYVNSICQKKNSTPNPQ